MDLFKFLRKRQIEGLEILLQKAVNDPAYRAEFLKRLLNEKLFVITNKNEITEGYVKLQSATTISIINYTDGKIPVFTSTDRIFDKGVIKEQVKYLGLKGADLFGILKGKTIVLNPYSDYGKELLPDEIDRLLDGTYLSTDVRHIKIKKSTNVNIGQPSRYPKEAVKASIKLLSEKPEVIAAYLAWIHDPSSGDPPHYIFGLHVTDNYAAVSQEMGFTVNQILGGEIFDIIRLTGAKGIEDYFVNSTKPFYTRKN